MANIKYLTNLDLRGNALLSANLEQLSAAPTDATAGRVYFDTTLGAAQVYTGSAWVRLDSAAALAAVEELTTQVATDIADAVAAEATLRSGADALLNTAIENVASDLLTESTDRAAADAQVALDASNALTAATGTLNTAIGVVASDLAAEVTAREAAVAQALLDAAADATTKANAAQTAAEGYAATAVSNAISNLVDNAPEALDTIAELAAALTSDQGAISGILTSLDEKQDAVNLIADVRAGIKAGLTVTVTGAFDRTITHNLGTNAVTVQVFEAGQQVEVGVEILNANQIKITGNAGPGDTALLVVITG